MKNHMAIPQKLKIDLSYDPTILLVGIYLKELKAGSPTGICILMSIAASFTLAKKVEVTHIKIDR